MPNEIVSSPKGPITVHQIARLARTSASTVSRVMNNDARISASTQERVRAVMRKYDYRPNLFARALAGGRTGLIGVLSSNIDSGFFAEVFRGIDLITKSSATHLICSFAHDTADYFALAQDLLTGGQVQGLILIDPPMELYSQPLPANAIPAVLCASRARDARSSWQGVDSVTADNVLVMNQLVEHLVQQGFRHLIHLAGLPNIHDAITRRRAFEEAVSNHAKVHSSIEEGHLIEEDGQRTALRYLKEPATLPDAFIAFNDSTAQGLLETLQAQAHTAAHPVAVTGWDNSVASRFLGLTSVAIPMRQLGETAANLLLDRMKNAGADRDEPHHVELPCEVHFRPSSQTVPAGR